MSPVPDARDVRIERLRRLLAESRLRTAAMREAIDALAVKSADHTALVGQVRALSDALAHSQRELQAARRAG